MSHQTIYKCDRCKENIEKYELPDKLIIGYHHDTIYDVCPKCLNKFKQFMKRE